jgi:hypothetical protein
MKIGHVTCDNASNNTTMMKEFAARLLLATRKEYDWERRKIKYVLSISSQLVRVSLLMIHDM